ncbi:MAG: YdcF family protein [Saprospiraceae bacterium]|nr:YdcF family protein [Saprospiraceae bacterium]
MKQSLLFIAKKGLIWGGLGSFLALLFTVGAHLWIKNSAVGLHYQAVEAMPKNDVALLLGTNRLINGKFPNPYFESRIAAAVELFEAGKVKHLLISGDHSRAAYNEPQDMMDALVAAGIPEGAITLDYAGFRTLDSVVRAKEVFQQERFTIISQAFHNERALFIAQGRGLQAIAYDAKLPHTHPYSKVRWREYLARAKAVLDLYVLNKQPKFLGEAIAIHP